jgi:hypothetical protein
VGGRAVATKYNRGVGLQTGVPGESNNSTRVTFVRVPARMATALALPRGSRANGLVLRHGRTLASRTLCRRGMGFWLAPKRIGRDDGSRNGGEVRITLLNATDGKSLVATVVSRAVKSLYQSSQHLEQSMGIGSRSLVTSANGAFLICVGNYRFIMPRPWCWHPHHEVKPVTSRRLSIARPLRRHSKRLAKERCCSALFGSPLRPTR